MYLPSIKHAKSRHAINSWFREWFDSEDYHTLYNHTNQEEAESFIQHLHDLINRPNMRVLDMAYGKGRRTNLCEPWA